MQAKFPWYIPPGYILDGENNAIEIEAWWLIPISIVIISNLLKWY